jgi:hypothetical protein
VRKFSRRTTIFMVATGVLLTASLAFAGLLVSGESEAFTGSVEGDVSPGTLTVTAVPVEDEVTFGPGGDPNGEPITVTVQNDNDYSVALGRPDDVPPVPAVKWDAVASAGSGNCTEEDFDFLGPTWEDVTLAAKDEVAGGPDTVSGVFTIKLKDASVADCSGATVSFTVTVTGDGPDVDGDDEELTGSDGV